METCVNLVEYLTEKRDEGIIVWLCNIGAEKYWNNLSPGVVDVDEDIIVNRIEEMNLLICRKQDFMILRESPDEKYLDALREIGFSVPHILSLDTDDLVTPISQLVLNSERTTDRLTELSKIHGAVYFVPYAVTWMEERIAEICGLKILGAPSAVCSIVNDKVFSREIAERLKLPVCDGKVCSTIDEIKSAYRFLKTNPPYYEAIIIKEPFGASGKGLYIVDRDDMLDSIALRLARNARKNKDSRWLVEGWYSKKADVNYQIYISPNGEVNVFSIKRQVLVQTVYIGSKMPSCLDDDTIRRYLNYGKEIGRYLFEIGYTGVAGIDSIIDENDVIIPVVEINGRFTLSTYISFIQSVLGKRKFMTKYHRVVTRSPMDFSDICKKLDGKGVLYSRQKGKGVFVSTAGTLPTRFLEGKGYCIGRLFLLMVAEQWREMDDLNEKVEEIIQEISLQIK